MLDTDGQLVLKFFTTNIDCWLLMSILNTIMIKRLEKPMAMMLMTINFIEV